MCTHMHRPTQTYQESKQGDQNSVPSGSWSGVGIHEIDQWGSGLWPPFDDFVSTDPKWPKWFTCVILKSIVSGIMAIFGITQMTWFHYVHQCAPLVHGSSIPGIVRSRGSKPDHQDPDMMRSRSSRSRSSDRGHQQIMTSRNHGFRGLVNNDHMEEILWISTNRDIHDKTWTRNDPWLPPAWSWLHSMFTLVSHYSCSEQRLIIATKSDHDLQTMDPGYPVGQVMTNESRGIRKG